MSKYNIFFWVLCFIMTISGCKEFLPPRSVPQELFQIDIYFYYAYSETENNYYFRIAITNIYDETIEDTVSVNGKLEIILARDPIHSKTVSLGDQFIEPSFAYNSTTQILTLDPGKTIYLRYIWDFTDDNGINLTDSVFSYAPDPECLNRLKSTRESFFTKGFVQLTKHTGSFIFGPKTFSSAYLTPFVSPKDCTSSGSAPHDTLTVE